MTQQTITLIDDVWTEVLSFLSSKYLQMFTVSKHLYELAQKSMQDIRIGKHVSKDILQNVFTKSPNIVSIVMLGFSSQDQQLCNEILQMLPERTNKLEFTVCDSLTITLNLPNLKSLTYDDGSLLFTQLPNTLTSLRAELGLFDMPSDNYDLSSLPRGLTRIQLINAVSSFNLNSFQYIPLHLTHLELNGSFVNYKLDKNSIIQICKCKSLKVLDISDCTSVTVLDVFNEDVRIENLYTLGVRCVIDDKQDYSSVSSKESFPNLEKLKFGSELRGSVPVQVLVTLPNTIREIDAEYSEILVQDLEHVPRCVTKIIVSDQNQLEWLAWHISQDQDLISIEENEIIKLGWIYEVPNMIRSREEQVRVLTRAFAQKQQWRETVVRRIFNTIGELTHTSKQLNVNRLEMIPSIIVSSDCREIGTLKAKIHISMSQTGPTLSVHALTNFIVKSGTFEFLRDKIILHDANCNTPTREVTCTLTFDEFSTQSYEIVQDFARYCLHLRKMYSASNK